jgi:hypothetical protein
VGWKQALVKYFDFELALKKKGKKAAPSTLSKDRQTAARKCCGFFVSTRLIQGSHLVLLALPQDDEDGGGEGQWYETYNTWRPNTGFRAGYEGDKLRSLYTHVDIGGIATPLPPSSSSPSSPTAATASACLSKAQSKTLSRAKELWEDMHERTEHGCSHTYGCETVGCSHGRRLNYADLIMNPLQIWPLIEKCCTQLSKGGVEYSTGTMQVVKASAIVTAGGAAGGNGGGDAEKVQRVIGLKVPDELIRELRKELSSIGLVKGEGADGAVAHAAQDPSAPIQLSQFSFDGAAAAGKKEAAQTESMAMEREEAAGVDEEAMGKHVRRVELLVKTADSQLAKQKRQEQKLARGSCDAGDDDFDFEDDADFEQAGTYPKQSRQKQSKQKQRQKKKRKPLGTMSKQ